MRGPSLGGRPNPLAITNVIASLQLQWPNGNDSPQAHARPKIGIHQDISSATRSSLKGSVRTLLQSMVSELLKSTGDCGGGEDLPMDAWLLHLVGSMLFAGSTKIATSIKRI